MPELKDLIAYGPTIVILALLLWRGLPSWDEVKLREMEIRHEEVSALQKLGEGLNQVAAVLKSVAVEQRRATETIRSHAASQCGCGRSCLARNCDSA